MKYVIEAASAINPMRHCLLGVGDTETAAWENAIGPKPWTKTQKRVARNSWAREVTEQEADELEHAC